MRPGSRDTPGSRSGSSTATDRTTPAGKGVIHAVADSGCRRIWSSPGGKETTTMSKLNGDQPIQRLAKALRPNEEQTTEWAAALHECIDSAARSMGPTREGSDPGGIRAAVRQAGRDPAHGMAPVRGARGRAPTHRRLTRRNTTTKRATQRYFPRAGARPGRRPWQSATSFAECLLTSGGAGGSSAAEGGFWRIRDQHLEEAPRGRGEEPPARGEHAVGFATGGAHRA